MKALGHILLFFSSFHLGAQIIEPQDLPMEGVMRSEESLDETNEKYEEMPEDISKFPARVTDYDHQTKLVKIKVENNNTKFLRSGDVVLFKVNLHPSDYYCRGNVRTIEDYYVTLHVHDLSSCWKDVSTFRRGMMVNIFSEDLKIRLSDALKTRETLINRKKSLLKQLANINNEVWSYGQNKTKIAAEYDLRIQEIERKKQKSLDNLQVKNKENIEMREMLVKKLDLLDRDIKFYQKERQELLLDRWQMDHDTGMPMAQRPQAPLD